MATDAFEVVEDGSDTVPTFVKHTFLKMDVRESGAVSRADLTDTLRHVDEKAWPDESLHLLFSELFPEGNDAICVETFATWASKGSVMQEVFFATMNKTRARPPFQPPPAHFLKSLPRELPEGEPYYYLSAAQRVLCQRMEPLRPYKPHLPGWVPHRKVADALQLGHAGIESALRRLGGQPYVWGTEFENVHTLWHFREPRIIVDGREYACSENFYQESKPHPFNDAVWSRKRDGVMRTAVRHKFDNENLKQLLLSTGQHPLLSIKGDEYWGVLPNGRGENKLAVMLMELRDEWRELPE